MSDRHGGWQRWHQHGQQTASAERIYGQGKAMGLSLGNGIHMCMGEKVEKYSQKTENHLAVGRCVQRHPEHWLQQA